MTAHDQRVEEARKALALAEECYWTAPHPSDEEVSRLGMAVHHAYRALESAIASRARAPLVEALEQVSYNLTIPKLTTAKNIIRQALAAAKEGA